MDELHEVFEMYAELAMKAHKLEDAFLEIPKAAARKAGINVNLLFTCEIKPELLKKLNELKEAEKQRDQARQKWINILGS